MERYVAQVQGLIPRAYNARHVLACMLIGRPNLAQWTPTRFAQECANALEYVDMIGPDVAEQSAQRWRL